MRNQKGQALLIAVLLMTVILLVGAIFVAITVYVQGQTQRHGQMRQAKQMCDSGIQYADRMLQLHTADWQPADPPAWCAGGDDAFDAVDAILDPSYAGDDVFDPGFWGADGTPETGDDYYTPEELERGWCALRLGSPLPDADGDGVADRTPADLAARGATVRRGFTRIPDPRDSTVAGEGSSVSEGHTLLRLTYDPDPPFEGTPDEDIAGDPDGDGQAEAGADGQIDGLDTNDLSRMIRIESIGAVLDETYTFRRLVAYKPLALTDYTRFVTDKTGTGQPAYLGIPPWIDLDRDGQDAGIGEWYVTSIQGGVRANTELVLIGEETPVAGDYGSVQIVLHNDELGERIEATGGIRFQDRAAAPQDDQADVLVYGASTTEHRPILPSDPQLPGDAAFETYGALSLSGSPLIVDGRQGTDGAGYGRFCPTLSAPSLFRPDPTTGRTPYEELTRYSGVPVGVDRDGDGSPDYWANSGEWAQGEGVYIDNETDRQFLNSDGECDLQALMDDWLRNISPTDARAGDSGWNGTHTTYTPVGVEIWIVGQELPSGTYQAQADPRSPAPIPDTVLWTPEHAAGEPQIVLQRHDRPWMTATGQSSGRYTMVIDHPSRLRGTGPTNQVILAAGNVRVRGRLPDRGPMPSPGAGETAAAVPYPDYNLTIVSGGTIYIDGPLMSPRFWVPLNAAADYSRDTRLALLAHDCVCMNSTRIVPQEATALVSAVPDDTSDPRPEASHWELTPEAGARVFSTFQLGPYQGSHVFLAPILSGREPGPAALSMSVKRGWTGVWQPFTFGGATDPLRFIFMPPGVAADVNISTALTPNYQPLPDPDASPTIPWDITPYVDMATGTLNTLQLQWANPAIGAGATVPWVKKWKLVQSDNPDPNVIADTWIPGVDCVVCATMYAETGCWFIIPGDWFEPIESIDRALGPADMPGVENINGRIDTDNERDRARAYARYNYWIRIFGSVTESFTAPPSAVREWTDKWAIWRTSGLMPGGLNSVEYQGNFRARNARDRGDSGAANGTLGSPIPLRSTEAANLPLLPSLPVGDDLIYYGETM